MNALLPLPGITAPAPFDDHVEQFITASKAERTRQAYASDWTHFETWCNERGEVSLPASPECIARYISAHADTHKPATLQRRLASISIGHQAAGYESPTSAPIVRAVMQGIRRTVGTAQRQSSPLMVEHVRKAVSSLDDSALGVRNKAILLLGLAGAFRRSELVALNVGDLELRDQGVVVTLRRSKTNQEGEPETKDIGYGIHEDTCPVLALRRWLELAGITQGAVFRAVSPSGVVLPRRLGDRAVSRIVKAAAERIGLSPEEFSGHSLRAGFTTQAYREGISEIDIMAQTGHKSRSVLTKYRREGERFRVNYSGKIGL